MGELGGEDVGGVEGGAFGDGFDWGIGMVAQGILERLRRNRPQTGVAAIWQLWAFAI